MNGRNARPINQVTTNRLKRNNKSTANHFSEATLQQMRLLDATAEREVVIGIDLSWPEMYYNRVKGGRKSVRVRILQSGIREKALLASRSDDVGQ